nr:unnamed protein product [Spirometra erinaceieuropaei]
MIYRPHRLASARLVTTKAQFVHMLQMSIIRQSESPWASPLHLVPKAVAGGRRPCSDSRARNNVTVSDNYPVPHLKDFADALLDKSVFSKMDLVRAFLRIPTASEDVSKTAITTPFGLFLRMPVGLRNASQTFQMSVDKVHRGLPFAYAYIDDFLVASSITEEYMEHLAMVSDRLRQVDVVLNLSTFVFRLPSLKCLGHLVDFNGIHPLLYRVAAIRDFPPPYSKRQLQRFLSSRLLPHCADTTLTLTNLLSGPKGSFEPPADALAAFDKIKAALADATLLTYFSPDAPISLMVGASNVAVRAVLQQHLAGHAQPLAFFSRKSSSAETRNSKFGRKLSSVFLAVKRFRYFLGGREFTVSTNRKPLFFIPKSTSVKLNPREIRQLDYITQFTSDIRHIDGPHDEVADALLRSSIAHFQFSSGVDPTRWLPNNAVLVLPVTATFPDSNSRTCRSQLATGPAGATSPPLSTVPLCRYPSA